MVSSAVGSRPQPERDDAHERDPTDGGPSQTMAKRVRGNTSRPGQRAPLQRSARTSPKPGSTTAKPAASATDVVAPPPDSLTDFEEARAAELEAEIVAEEKRYEADAARQRSRMFRGSAENGPQPRVTSSLAVAAADEYGYVARDVRRIAIVGGGLVGLLLILWAIATATGFRL
jgi:hypothetical protein